jgi:putative MFS transporter
LVEKGHIINDFLGLNYQNWQIAYLIGGSLGLILLFMRAGAFESGMFKEALNNSGIKKGNLMLIFKSGKNIKKYLYSIAIGLPIWCVIGILISLANQFGEATLVTTPVTVAKAIFMPILVCH